MYCFEGHNVVFSVGDRSWPLLGIMWCWEMKLLHAKPEIHLLEIISQTINSNWEMFGAGLAELM